MSITGDFRFLHKYLLERYADTVVLTFRQIEDLLGFPLPAPALVDPAWWTESPRDTATPHCSEAWRQAHRSATPNLIARHVVFERIT